LGSFPTRAHRVTGQVVVVSERVLEIRGFVFDGQAPAVFFWADVNPTPSIGGFVLYDAAPSNGCGNKALEAADGSRTYQVEFPEGKSVRDILGGSISVWCEEFAANFGEVRCSYFGLYLPFHSLLLL
jgi:Electron transfer DM13